MTVDERRAVRVFYSYAHPDATYRERLDHHLKLMERQGLIEPWHSRMIQAGQEWKGVVDRKLEEADLILLLISAEFMASDYCWDVELARALQHHQDETARVIPILLRPVGNWQHAPFAGLQVLPKNGVPVTGWADQDSAWAAVSEGIFEVVESLRSRPGCGPPVRPAAVRGGARPARAAAPAALPRLGALRRFVHEVLAVEGDFQAFCMEHFPEASGRMSSGMERMQKVLLLLQIAMRDGDVPRLLLRLREDFPQAYRQNEGLLG